ncbi:MAG: hypothetical protein ACPLY7_00885, partial [Microgenomates group bacterium]
ETAESKSLPRDLQKAQKHIFNPLLKFLNNQGKELFQKVKENGLQKTCRILAETILNSPQPLPSSLLQEYQNYVAQLVKLEAGIIKPEPNLSEQKPTKIEPAKVSLPTAAISIKSTFPSEAPPPTEILYSFSVVLGKDPEKSIPVPDLDTLKKLIERRKIKGLGPVRAEDIWNHLKGFSQMTPIQIRERYGERVAGGPFEGWYKIPLGGKCRIIFEIKNNQVFFRVGSHEDIYATSRRHPPDRARRL